MPRPARPVHEHKPTTENTSTIVLVTAAKPITLVTVAKSITHATVAKSVTHAIHRYDRSKCAWRYILDTQLICAMAPPGGARAVISARTQSRFNVLNLTVPNDSQVRACVERFDDYSLCL